MYRPACVKWRDYVAVFFFLLSVDFGRGPSHTQSWSLNHTEAEHSVPIVQLVQSEGGCGVKNGDEKEGERRETARGKKASSSEE